MKEIVFSKVFQEVWELYNEEKYFFLDKYIINKLIDDYIRFFPFRKSNSCAQTDKFSMLCYVSTVKKKIFNEYDKCIDEKIYNSICEVLNNAIIIIIMIHELNHLIYDYLYFTHNCMIPFSTPRNDNINIQEGGFLIELILFGRVIDKMNLKESIYILNKNNYKKSLSKFRDGFNFIDVQDLKIDDDNFKELNEIIINKKDYPKIMESIFIKAKQTKNNNNDDYFYIYSNLRGDIIGRNIPDNEYDEFLKKYTRKFN